MHEDDQTFWQSGGMEKVQLLTLTGTIGHIQACPTDRRLALAIGLSLCQPTIRVRRAVRNEVDIHEVNISVHRPQPLN